MATVILGSKPNPVLPKDFDTIVYVNGSIYYSEHVSEHVKSYHIFTDYYFNPTPLTQSLSNVKNECMRGKKIDRVILFETFFTTSATIENCKKKLADLDYSYKQFNVLSRKEKWQMFQNELGRSFLPSVLLHEKNIRSLVGKTLYYIRNGFVKSGLSAGIMSLLYALHHKIGTPPYYICGIGLENDGYHYRSSTVIQRGHIEIDQQILKKMAKKQKHSNSIYSTDKILSIKTQIPYFDFGGNIQNDSSSG